MLFHLDFSSVLHRYAVLALLLVRFSYRSFYLLVDARNVKSLCDSQQLNAFCHLLDFLLYSESVRSGSRRVQQLNVYLLVVVWQIRALYVVFSYFRIGD